MTNQILLVIIKVSQSTLTNSEVVMADKQEKNKNTLKTAKWYDSPLNKRIRDLLSENKIKHEDFAKKLGISTEAVRLWCAGYARPDVDKIIVIANALKVSTDYLLGKSDVRSPDITDIAISEKLGLSDEAIAFLKITNENAKDWSMKTATSREILSKINFLLKHESKYKIFEAISLYFGVFTPSAQLSTDDLEYVQYLASKEEIESIIDKSRTHFVAQNLLTNKFHLLSSDIINISFLTLIQTRLSKIRNDIVGENSKPQVEAENK